ncbi:glycerophosphodiester phosphodiesterase family protein [uncultured Sphaerochaeta sp.]|uniref:glycerophosphodiester phosphodiesterase family protein n=1 Tax=uncultured Sphaerochaeta sp. TaxID=886478 RepID=UPI002A0A4247|nr:glycerophosphodiester phosphodiesterase family protein [uncultured Sphaerochaeta sp.]
MDNPVGDGKVRIAAHRGSWGGSIFPNTISAFENALVQGADIIEMDVVKSRDDQFFVLNDEQIPSVLDLDQDIFSMTAEQMKNTHYLSYTFRKPQKECINSLDAVLEHFKGRCLINLDRSWNFWPELFPVLKDHAMFDQIILKSPPVATQLQYLENFGLHQMYMPIIKRPEDRELANQYNVNKVAVEIVFNSEQSAVVAPSFLHSLQKEGLALWVNTLTLTDDINLCAGHDDRSAIAEGQEKHWGWLLDRGFTIFQSDWPLLLRTYLQERKKSQ